MKFLSLALLLICQSAFSQDVTITTTTTTAGVTRKPTVFPGSYGPYGLMGQWTGYPRYSGTGGDVTHIDIVIVNHSSTVGALQFRFVSKFTFETAKIAEVEKTDPKLKGQKSLSVRMDDGNEYVVYLP